ncbi:non-ribosomal peptide synthetase [Rhodococcus sp. MEB064]|uniref:non-ribosomal peptide synthetase n=1 Tax=Rhodococcus sp. MEB064 TaxID=1587522 RepID=UPI0005AC63A1|nr:non-ribosomal peptide synthetase [Rhodococcus sp. MEB064]KIQ19867.1 hypothetical protein RU01_02915 [Rhodococcus sp. MEB064]
MIDGSLPLTSAQTAVWYAQQLAPDLPFTIAYCVDITGDIDVDALVTSGSTAHAEYRTSTLRIADQDGRPCQRFVDATAHDIDVVDLRPADDSFSIAHRSMQELCGRAVPLDGPLVLSRIFRLADDRVLWFTRAHHIVQDGHTSMLVLERTAALYRALVDGRPAPPVDVPTPQTLVDDDITYSASPRLRRDTEFWADRSDRPAVRWGAVRRPRPVSARTHESTADRSNAHGSLGGSGTATMIAAVAVLLSRMCSVQDVRLSLPVSARATATSKRAGSTMSAVVPLDLDGIGDSTVGGAVSSTEVALRSVLRRARSAATARAASGSRLSSSDYFGPTVNIMMFAESIPIGNLHGRLEILQTGPVSDIAVNIYPQWSGDGARVEFEGNPATHSAADLEVLRRRYLHVLDAFSNPETDVASIDLSLPEELPPTPASVGSPADTSSTLTEIFRDAVDTHGDSPALTSGGVTLTYRQVATRVDRLANILLDHGVGPDDAVAVRVPRSVSAVVAFWAIARVGAVHVPVDPALPAERARFILDDCSARTGLGEPGPLRLPTSRTTWIALDDVRPKSPVERRDDSSRRDPLSAAYIVYTSGSTGSPKGVVVTHSGIGPLVQHIRSHYGLGPASRISMSAALGFDTAIVELVAAAATGASLAICPPEVIGGSELAEFLVDQDVSHLLATPSVLSTIDPRQIPAVGTVIVGGEESSSDLLASWSLGRRLLEAYGPTETTCSVTMTDTIEADTRTGIGTAMTGVRIHLLDGRLRPVVPGAVGEIYIDTAGLARGYLGKHGTTSTRFVADPFSPNGSRLFRSGDRARCRADGTLEFHGRDDDQVQIRGNRVELGEIDSTLRRHPDVAAAAVSLRRTPGGSSRIDGYIVPMTGTTPDADDIRRFAAASLPPHMVPSSIRTLDAIPLTVNRKVDRRALPEPIARDADPHAAPPRGATEELIAQTFLEVLAVDGIGAESSFFDLGGDSLAATRVVSRLRVAAGIDVGVRDLVASPTVRALALVLDSRDAHSERFSRATPGLSDGVSAVPLAPQQRDIDFDATLPLSNLPFTLDITGPFDLDAASAAFDDLAARHRTLRTRFPDSPVGPHQLVDDTSSPTVLAPQPFSDRAVAAFLSEPIDIRRELPVRVRVFVDASDHHVIACVVHHAAADGWALGILGRDFAVAYRARSSGHAPSWSPPRPVQYSDYSVWAESRSVTDDVEFWRSELHGANFTSTPPPDRPRPATWSFDAGRRTLHLDADGVRDVDAVANRHGVGRFTVVRTALMILVAQLTGSEDVVVGTPVIGRDDPILEEIVGTFSTTVAIRTDLSGATTVAEALDCARASETRAFDHTAVPLADIADVVDPGPHHQRHPLFQVALSFDVLEPVVLDVHTGTDGDRTRITVTPRPLDMAKCDLHLHVTEHRDPSGDHWEVGFVYPTALYEGSTVQEFTHMFRRILDTIGSDSDAPWRLPDPARTAPELLHVL